MGRVRRITEGARSRYLTSKPGLCSQKFASDWGRPASTRATLKPASDRRLQAQPPDAPEPTTATSNITFDWSTIGFPLVGAGCRNLCENGPLQWQSLSAGPLDQP